MAKAKKSLPFPECSRYGKILKLERKVQETNVFIFNCLICKTEGNDCSCVKLTTGYPKNMSTGNLHSKLSGTNMKEN
jgi:hypothetical protein